MSEFRLKVFESVARNLSFTKSSRELFISQPAISKHIRELESQYHTRLFERMGNRIALTESGRLLMEHTQRLLDEYARLDYEMNLLHDAHCGTLRLGASTTIAQYVLPPLLARFIEKFPNVSVSLLNGNSEEVERALQEHRIDLGLVEGNIRQASLKYTPFMKDELVAVVNARSQWKDCDEIPLDDLRRIPLVLRERGSGTLDVVAAALARHEIRLSDLNVQMYLGSTESIKLFLRNSNALAIVSIRSISEELYMGRFKVVDIPGLEMDREFDYVELHGDEGGMARLFMDFADRYKTKL